MSNKSKNLTLITAGGRIKCRRCQATSKRTKLQCCAPAIKGKRVCRTHGGRSTGPKTTEGRHQCSLAKMLHGNETREIRQERSRKYAELCSLLLIGKKIGLFALNVKVRGRKPPEQG